MMSRKGGRYSNKLSQSLLLKSFTDIRGDRKKVKIIQAGAELGQAQLKLGLDFTLTFCRFGFVELDCRISFCRFDWKDLV